MEYVCSVSGINTMSFSHKNRNAQALSFHFSIAPARPFFLRTAQGKDQITLLHSHIYRQNAVGADAMTMSTHEKGLSHVPDLCHIIGSTGSLITRHDTRIIR